MESTTVFLAEVVTRILVNPEVSESPEEEALTYAADVVVVEVDAFDKKFGEADRSAPSTEVSDAATSGPESEWNLSRCKVRK